MVFIAFGVTGPIPPTELGLTDTTSTGLLLAAYFTFGIGFGLVNAPITNTAVTGMPPAQAGVAAAIASTSRQVGQSLGVAIVGAVGASALAGSQHIARTSHSGWWIVVACGAAVVVLGIATTTRWAKATARRTLAQFEPATSSA